MNLNTLFRVLVDLVAILWTTICFRVFLVDLGRQAYHISFHHWNLSIAAYLSVLFLFAIAVPVSLAILWSLHEGEPPFRWIWHPDQLGGVAASRREWSKLVSGVWVLHSMGHLCAMACIPADR